MFKLPLTFLCCFALIGGACAPAGGGSSDATVSGEGEGEGETEGDRDGGEGGENLGRVENHLQARPGGRPRHTGGRW